MPRILSRRTFLMTGAAVGGTALVAAVGATGYLASLDVEGLHGGRLDGDDAILNAFVVIHRDGTVVINVPRTEMGQGIHTGLATVVAEELDIPFDDRISVVFPTDAHPAYSAWTNALQVRPEEASGPVAWFGRRVLGQLGMIATGASGSVMGLWHPMRVAGASARAMIVAAAAERLDVPASELTTEDGMVIHAASGRSLAYGDLAQDAALLTPPDEPRLKSREEWRLIGRSQPRIDIPAKVRGEAMFGIDVVLPDMLHASIRHAPVFGAEVAVIRNEGRVRAADGVLDIAVIDGRHVAVVAGSWWQAEQAAWLLDIEWTETGNESETSDSLADRMYAALETDTPHDHIDEGDIESAFAAPDARLVEADYDVPYVTHACMESMNATAVLQNNLAEVWAPSQNRATMRMGVMRGMGWAGVRPDEVTLNITMAGGAFGRRSDLDVVAEASCLAARYPGRPVKVLWSREEDIGRGVYRSQAAARLRAVLGPDGLPSGYDAMVATQSIMNAMSGRNLPVTVGPDGDYLSVEGLEKAHYAIPSRRMRSQNVPSHLPIHFWRSNGYSFNTFFTESFIDECADAAGADPVAYRRDLLRDNPRHLAVLDRVAEMAGWSDPLPPGRGRGIAIEECYRSVVAQVAEVTVSPDGEVRVDRMVCALDAGLAINPDQVVAQIEGGIVYGVTAALMNRITIEGGAVAETNFHDFAVQRIANAPRIEVSIVESDGPPCGVGEPGVVPAAAAVANAIFAATGRRLRSLPLAVTETIGERRTRSVLPAERA
ncbi:xanthine dehydrogenase family protein molybdopterin-binding subunit [Pelagovum pacificum]|uniref:Xanthine dehydrogenase family protein molybdopterin-binding subunit n=1 Tax=Pelagovum pacificum TaxID=2588711 RepID=A0A5C5GBJ1_9RHOB|nr:molybdopterin cofactor-binding domain-containing protein [Pelagovum pacificum]QQA41173.1 xanthine dehydrogenase family protein molybdopterin-binding subunit [Pelagovum pacificum]TNY32018.1 xanthine dehydrogenase family protein molybdopterin-binding subunit [Pelagovum pacificum]